MGDGSQKGPGTHSKQRDFVLSHSHACWGVTSLWNNEMAWKKLISYFANVVTPSPLQVNRSWSQPMLQDTATVAAVLCWDVGWWSVGMGSLELSMGWPALTGGSWAPQELRGFLCLLVRLTMSCVLSWSPGKSQSGLRVHKCCTQVFVPLAPKKGIN